MPDMGPCKTNRLAIMLSLRHRHALELLAIDDEESLSAIMRGLILKEARARGLWPRGEEECLTKPGS